MTADILYISSNINVSGTSNFNSILISDNTTLLSSLNVSGFSNLNNLIVNNSTAMLSSLSVGGFTDLNNETNINAPLYISGVNVLETVNAFDTVLSTLHVFRSDNAEAIVNYNTKTNSTEIHNYSGGEIVLDSDGKLK